MQGQDLPTHGEPQGDRDLAGAGLGPSGALSGTPVPRALGGVSAQRVESPHPDWERRSVPPPSEL